MSAVGYFWRAPRAHYARTTVFGAGIRGIFVVIGANGIELLAGGALITWWRVRGSRSRAHDDNG